MAAPTPSDRYPVSALTLPSESTVTHRPPAAHEMPLGRSTSGDERLQACRPPIGLVDVIAVSSSITAQSLVVEHDTAPELIGSTSCWSVSSRHR